MVRGADVSLLVTVILIVAAAVVGLVAMQVVIRLGMRGEGDQVRAERRRRESRGRPGRERDDDQPSS